MTVPASKTDPPSASKVTLYCFDCGHESPIEGDWEIRLHGDGVDYDCPECSTTITTRPRSNARIY